MAANTRTIATRPPAFIPPAYRSPPEGLGIVQPTKSSGGTAELFPFDARVSEKTAAEFRGPNFSSLTTGCSGTQARQKPAHGPPPACWRSHTALTHGANGIECRRRRRKGVMEDGVEGTPSDGDKKGSKKCHIGKLSWYKSTIYDKSGRCGKKAIAPIT